MKKKMLFIVNPMSGKGQIKNNLVAVLDIFTKADYQIEVYITQGPQDALKKAKVSGDQYDLLVCCGGDGTLNEVINGVMPFENKPDIGYIPAGTTCDFAYSHRIPKDMIKAAKAIVNGKPVSIDLGELDNQYFTYVAAFGAFTEIPYQTSQALKSVMGHSAYIIEGAKSLLNLKPHYGTVKVNGQVVEGNIMMGMVANSNRVAGFKGLTGKNVGLDDGLFEVLIVVDPVDVMQWTDTLSALMQGRECTFVHRFTTSEIEFIMNEEVDWVLDGEYGGKSSHCIVRNRQKIIKIIKKSEKLLYKNLEMTYN